MAIAIKTVERRLDWLSYQALLDTDTHPVPEVLRRANPIVSRQRQPSRLPTDETLCAEAVSISMLHSTRMPT